MGEVPIRELNQDTAGVLARVKRGEEIDVTERGVVIARLVPAQAHPLADLIAAWVTASGQPEWPDPSSDGSREHRRPARGRALPRSIHLATAQVVIGSCLTAFVTYDRRLLGLISGARPPRWSGA
jgi:prevent-host-death family protein